MILLSLFCVLIQPILFMLYLFVHRIRIKRVLYISNFLSQEIIINDVAFINLVEKII